MCHENNQVVKSDRLVNIFHMFIDVNRKNTIKYSNQLLSPYTVALRLRDSRKLFTCMLWAQKC
jgi:hypothetical protein